MTPLRIRLRLALLVVDAILTPRCHTVTDAARNADALSHMAACPNRRSRQVDVRSAIAEDARTGEWPLIACRCHVNTVDRIVTTILAHRSR